jgi:hypothetical protein
MKILSKKVLVWTLIALVILSAVGYLIFKMVVKEKFASVTTYGMNGPISGMMASDTYELIEPNASKFADIVAPSGKPCGHMNACGCKVKGAPLPPKAGCDVDYRELLPEMSNASPTSFDADAADHETYIYRPAFGSAASAVPKNRQMRDADPLRGDLPIELNQNALDPNNRWFQSRYGPEDIQHNAYFSEFTRDKYRQLSGQRSYPASVVNEGLIMDGAKPASNELVMEWY